MTRKSSKHTLLNIPTEFKKLIKAISDALVVIFEN